MELIGIILKLILAIALGGLIGLEREASQKPAGFRTNILVCVGSAMMMMLAGLIIQAKGGNGDSLVRMAAGVLTGIGFLGAGTILHARGTVAGLTTASTIWLVAGLGLVIGAGYYVPAFIITALTIATLVLFRGSRSPTSARRSSTTTSSSSSDPTSSRASASSLSTTACGWRRPRSTRRASLLSSAFSSRPPKKRNRSSTRGCSSWPISKS